MVLPEDNYVPDNISAFEIVMTSLVVPIVTTHVGLLPNISCPAVHYVI